MLKGTEKGGGFTRHPALAGSKGGPSPLQRPVHRLVGVPCETDPKTDRISLALRPRLGNRDRLRLRPPPQRRERDRRIPQTMRPSTTTATIATMIQYPALEPPPELPYAAITLHHLLRNLLAAPRALGKLGVWEDWTGR